MLPKNLLSSILYKFPSPLPLLLALCLVCIFLRFLENRCRVDCGLERGQTGLAKSTQNNTESLNLFPLSLSLDFSPTLLLVVSAFSPWRTGVGRRLGPVGKNRVRKRRSAPKNLEAVLGQLWCEVLPPLSLVASLEPNKLQISDTFVPSLYWSLVSQFVYTVYCPYGLWRPSAGGVERGPRSKCDMRSMMQKLSEPQNGRPAITARCSDFAQQARRDSTSSFALSVSFSSVCLPVLGEGLKLCFPQPISPCSSSLSLSLSLSSGEHLTKLFGACFNATLLCSGSVCVTLVSQGAFEPVPLLSFCVFSLSVSSLFLSLSLSLSLSNSL